LVESEDVDAWFAEEAEIAILGEAGDDRLYLI
jgi:hypothetical protein